MKKLVLALIALLPVVAAAEPARNGSLTLTPAVVVLRGTYGQSTTQRLTLTNGTSMKMTFDLLARDVVVRNGQRMFVDAGQIDGSIAATAVFSRGHVTLQSGESTSVDVTFTMPPRTTCRAVAAMFRASAPIKNGTGSMVPAVGTLMTFRLSDEVGATGSGVVVRPQSRSANAAFAEMYTNTGAEPLVAKGVVAILDGSGALIGKAAMPPRRLLPSERVEMKSEYPGELRPGTYRVVLTVDLEGQTVTHDAQMRIQ